MSASKLVLAAIAALSAIAPSLVSRSAAALPIQGRVAHPYNPSLGEEGSGKGSSTGFMSLDPMYLSLGIYSGVAWLHSAPANENSLGKVGGTIYLSAGFGFFDLLAGNASFGALFPADRQPFQQEVVPQFQPGAPMNASSSVTVTNYSLAIGPRTPSFCFSPFSNGVDNCWAGHAFVYYGYAWVGGSRSIEKCSNCNSYDLNLANGSFLEPGLSFGMPSRQSVGIELTTSVRTYFGAALAGEWRIGFDLLFL
jgi:hypothetical protein